MSSKTVKPIQLSEVSKAANTLYEAFKHDPMMLWLCGGNENYAKVAKPLLETWVTYSVRYGKAFRTKNFEAVALRKKPGDHDPSFWRIFRSGMLKTPNILGKDGFARLKLLIDSLKSMANKNMGDKLYWYCWMLGTLPEKQKQGFGGALMQETFELAKKMGYLVI